MNIHGISPYLYYPDAGAALKWLHETFGFEEVARYVDDAGVVHEAETRAGHTVIMMAGRAPQTDEGAGQLLIVHVSDLDVLYARVAGQGVKASPPQEKPYGPRTFDVVDPWGYRWTFWQPFKPFVDGTGGLREVRPKTK